MPEIEYFTIVSNGIGAVGVDYVDVGVEPDEDVVYAFVDFIPREPPGTVHWLTGLSVPRGIQLDPVRGRYSSEDGKLRTIIGHPTDEKQLVTATGPFVLTYAGQSTTTIPLAATPPQVQAALEALSNLAVGDVYVSGLIHNEKQLVTIGGAATGGTFTMAAASAPTVKTGPISRNASASSMQAYLQALPAIGSDGCSVTGPTGGPWTVEFTGTLAGTDVGTLLGFSTGLTPSGTVTISTTVIGSAGTPFTVNFVGALQGTDVAQLTATGATVTTLTGGTPALGVELVANTPVLELDKPGVSEVQLVVVNGNPSSGTWTLALGGTPTTGLSGNISGAALQTALEEIIGVGNVTATKGGSQYTVTFAGEFADTAVDLLVANYSGLNRGSVTVTRIVEGKPDESADLIWDVVFTIPDLDPLREDRKVNPFGIVAPRVGGTVIDLADSSLHVSPKPK